MLAHVQLGRSQMRTRATSPLPSTWTSLQLLGPPATCCYQPGF
jgi:hypothetical protein